MYLATACDRAFFISADDLEITEVVDLPSDEYGAVVYRYENFVVAETKSGMAVFNLDQCAGGLGETCVSRVWNKGSVIPLGFSVKGRGERTYRDPLVTPSILFISSPDGLTIYDLDTQREAVLDGRLVGVSEDGTTVLFSKDGVYRLFDLEDWRAIGVETVPGQGLVLARDWI